MAQKGLLHGHPILTYGRKPVKPQRIRKNWIQQICNSISFSFYPSFILLCVTLSCKKLEWACELWAGIAASVSFRVRAREARHNTGFYLQPLTLLPFSASQNYPVPEAAEDQGAAAESDRGLWPANGHVLYGERGTRTISGHAVKIFGRCYESY